MDPESETDSTDSDEPDPVSTTRHHTQHYLETYSQTDIDYQRTIVERRRKYQQQYQRKYKVANKEKLAAKQRGYQQIYRERAKVIKAQDPIKMINHQ